MVSHCQLASPEIQPANARCSFTTIHIFYSHLPIALKLISSGSVDVLYSMRRICQNQYTQCVRGWRTQRSTNSLQSPMHAASVTHADAAYIEVIWTPPPNFQSFSWLCVNGISMACTFGRPCLANLVEGELGGSARSRHASTLNRDRKIGFNDFKIIRNSFTHPTTRSYPYHSALNR